MHLAERVVCLRGMHRRVHHARGHGIDRHAERGQFQRQRFRRLIHPALEHRRQQRRHARIGLNRQRRRHVHDPAAAALAHMTRRCLREVQRAFQIGRDLFFDFVRREAHERFGGEDTGIVDQHVHVPIGLDGPGESGARRGRIGDVARDRQESLACGQRSGRLLQTRAAAPRADDVVTVLQESLRQPETDAARGARDDDRTIRLAHDVCP